MTQFFGAAPSGGFPQQQQVGTFQAPTGKKYNDTLINLTNFNFPANNSFGISLIRRDPRDLTVKDFKCRHMFFVSMVPGVKNGNGRTYDYKQKVTFNFSLRELSSLGYVLKSCADGKDKLVLPYRKFANNEGNSKSLSVWMGNNKTENFGNQGQVESRQIVITTNSGGNNISISFSPAEAYGIGEVIDSLFKEGMRLEFEIQKSTPRIGHYNESADAHDVGELQSNGFVQQNAQSVTPNIYHTQQPTSSLAPSVPTQSFAPQPQAQPGFAQPMQSPVPILTNNNVQFPQVQTPGSFPGAQPVGSQDITQLANQFGTMLHKL